MRLEWLSGRERRKPRSSSEQREEEDGEERVGDVVYLEAV
jgi:hypothetical protein